MYTYLASPYSSRAETPEARHKERTERFYSVMHALAWLNRQKLWTYSPIVHCHEMAGRYSLPTDAHFWQEYNHAMIRAASNMTILCLPGWRDSLGVTEERQFCIEIQKPYDFLEVFTDGDLRNPTIEYVLKTSEPTT